MKDLVHIAELAIGAWVAVTLITFLVGIGVMIWLVRKGDKL